MKLNVLRVKKNKILHNLFYNGLTFIVGSFLMYRICVRLNPLNDYYVNKDMKYLWPIFGFVSILIRHLFVEISNHFSDKKPTLEDEIIEHMLMRDAERRYNEVVKREKKKRFDNFKLLR